jgi:hypothetical protein
MLEFTTMFKFYSYDKELKGKNKARILNTLEKVLLEKIPQDLDVKIVSLQVLENNRLNVQMEGENKDDIIFTINIFKQIMGETINNRRITKGFIAKGVMVSPNKLGFGIFVDIGLTDPAKEVLIPLFQMRKQLVNNEKLSVIEIVKNYGFMENLPVEIEIVKFEGANGDNPKYEGKLSSNFVEQIQKSVEQRLDIIYTTGVSRQNIKKTIAKRGHSQDIIEINRLGPLETAVVCKKGTTGPGIISHIGKFIPEAHFSTLQPKWVRKFWN